MWRPGEQEGMSSSAWVERPDQTALKSSSKSSMSLLFSWGLWPSTLTIYLSRLSILQAQNIQHVLQQAACLLAWWQILVSGRDEQYHPMCGTSHSGSLHVFGWGAGLWGGRGRCLLGKGPPLCTQENLFSKVIFCLCFRFHSIRVLNTDNPWAVPLAISWLIILGSSEKLK